MTEQQRTFLVTYDDGTEVNIKRCKPAKCADLVTLQKALIRHFLKHDGLPLELLQPSNTTVWEDMRRMGKLLPISGPDGEFLDPDRFAEDWDQLMRVFFTRTETINEEDGSVQPLPGETYKTSEIARLHGINFLPMMAETFRALQKEAQMEREVRERQQQQEQEAPAAVEGKPKRTKTKTEEIPLSA